MSENVKSRRSDKINIRNDIFDAFRKISDDENEETIDGLNTELLNLNLNDQTTDIGLQNEARALPINPRETNTLTNIQTPSNRNDGTNNPNNTNIPKPTKQNNGTIPKTTRTFTNSHSDDEVRTTPYQLCATYAKCA